MDSTGWRLQIFDAGGQASERQEAVAWADSLVPANWRRIMCQKGTSNRSKGRGKACGRGTADLPLDPWSPILFGGR